MANEPQKTLPAPGKPEVLKVVPTRPEHVVPKEDLEMLMVWYGSKRECPFYNLGLGGVTFCREIHQTRSGHDGAPDQLVPQDGNFHPLSRARVKEIMGRVAQTVIRIGGGRAEIWDVTHNNYVPDALDVPAGKFIYMQIVQPGQPFERRAENAPCMV